MNLQSRKNRRPDWRPGAVRLTWKAFATGETATNIDPSTGEVIVGFDESIGQAYTLPMDDFKRVLDASTATVPGMSVASATWSKLGVKVNIEQFPPEIILAHEFVHASHDISNTTGSGKTDWHFYDDSGAHLIDVGQSNEELQTVGLIGDQKYSENLIRYEQGQNLRIAYFVPQQPFETDTLWQARRASAPTGP